MTITIPLTKGYTATVDDCDADLAQHKWCARPRATTVYAQRNAGRTADGKQLTVDLHRVIGARIAGRELSRDEEVDHIDGTLNNCRSNLRIVTHAENMRNRRMHRNNSAGFKGVDQRPGYDRWRARIRIDGRQVVLGWFDTPELAYAAYCEAAIFHFGEYAHDGTRPLRLADAPVATRQLPLFPQEAA
jgi:hypothetical protein